METKTKNKNNAGEKAKRRFYQENVNKKHMKQQQQQS